MYDKPMKIGNLEIKNRFVRSATYEGMAHEGIVTDKHVELYKNLAEGGVGLIITGYAYVQKSGMAFEEMMGADNDELISDLRRIADIVHGHSKDCKIALQIAHCGRQSRALENTLAPSAVLEKAINKMPKEMSKEEIKETIEAFAQGVRRAKEAGFDAVQLHGAHGYLISEFFSPYTNKRTDDYGGSTENRFRFVEEIYNRSVGLVGKDFPILIKINGDDFLDGGITIEESKKIAVKLSQLGFAAIEVSGGMWETVTRSRKELGWKPRMIPESRKFVGTKNEPACNLPFAKEIKKVVDIPIIVVGGINSLDLVEKILREESADFVSFSRPMIREPNLPNRWLKGIGERTVECIYCSGCLSTLETTGLRCIKKEPEA